MKDVMDIFEPNVLENIFLNAPLGIFIADIHRRVLFANAQSATIHGYRSTSDLLGQIFPNFLDDPTDLIENLCDILEFSTDKVKVTYEITVNTKPKVVETTISVLKTSLLSPIGFLFFCDDITERANYEKEITRLNIVDSLTDLYNQRYLYFRLEQEIQRAGRDRCALSLILLDIDKFKNFNDRYGHLEGDKVLIKIGSIIKEVIRKVDLGFRYGGEEFVVVLPHANKDQSYQVAERIRKAFVGHTFSATGLKGNPAKVNKTISLGISTLIKGDKIKELIKRADAAMYVAKNNGGNKIEFEKLEKDPV